MKLLTLSFLFISLPALAQKKFETERPDKAKTSHTLEEGKFGFEPELINYSQAAEEKKFTLQLMEFFFRYGINEHSEIQLQIDTYVRESNTPGAERFEQSGMGEAELAYKYNLRVTKVDGVSIALMPLIRIPTAAANLSDKRWEGGLGVPFDFPLGKGWEAALYLETNNIRRNEDQAWQSNLATALSFKYHYDPLKTSAFLELFNESGLNQEEGNNATFNIALQYEVNENTRLDIGTFIGTSPDAEDTELFAGASFKL